MRALATLFDASASLRLILGAVVLLCLIVYGCLAVPGRQALGAIATAASSSDQPPIIGGRGDWTFRYLPDRLALPAGSCPTGGCNCKGLVIDRDSNIYLTYEPDSASPGDVRCMVRFKPDGTGGVPFGSPELCSGTPHGLTLVEEEDGQEYLYHANNAEVVHKTALDGTIVWSNADRPPEYEASMTYKPTWVAATPDSPHVYCADGYGSDYVHILDKFNGKFVGKMYGGRGEDPGTFSTCHGINVDSRSAQKRDDKQLLIVSDRENHRHQYFQYDPTAPDEFKYSSEFTVPELQRVCQLRPAPDGRHAVIPALEGPVGIVDEKNELVSVINVTGLIGNLGHLHPHDAIVLPSGDLVVATVNPGRISYWKRVEPAADPPNLSTA